MSTWCMYTTQGDLNCSKSEKIPPSTRQLPTSLINSKEHFGQPADLPLWNPNDKHMEMYDVKPANEVEGHFKERQGRVDN